METQDMTRSVPDDATEASRRELLSGNSLLRVAGASAAAALLASRAQAATHPASTCKTLVIYLRGAIDALSLIFPIGDNEYQTRRQALTLSDPPAGGTIDLDGTFGMNGAAQSLMTPFNNNDLAFALGVGSPFQSSLSHFSMQDYSEFGVFNGCTQDAKGWLGRYLSDTPPSGQDLDALAVSASTPITLQGAPNKLAIPDPEEYDLNGPPSSIALRRSTLELIYQQADDPLLSAGLGSLSVIDGLAGVSFAPEPGATPYPGGDFATALSQVSALFRDSTTVSPRAAVLNFGGWDDHKEQGPVQTNGAYYKRVKALADALRSFYEEMNLANVEYQVLVMSEFGRRIDMNANLGSDHGRGGLMIAMGNAGVNGGAVYSRTGPAGSSVNGWSGLVNHFDPIAGGDGTTQNLLCNISWWDVIGEYLVDRCGVNPARLDPQVFPCFSHYQPLGMFS